MNKTKVTIKAHRQVAKDTTQVTFERPDDFKFLAGQYVKVTLPTLQYPDYRGASREFSICSPPYKADEFSVVFRNTNSGFKQTLTSLKPGATVSVAGPFGFLTLPRSGQHIFIAGGIGIAPFRSMIHAAVYEDVGVNMRLLYANNSQKSAAYLGELQKLSAESSRFKLHSIRGQITTPTITRYVDDPLHVNWWIIGSPRMVADVISILHSLGAPNAKLHTEEFVGY